MSGLVEPLHRDLTPAAAEGLLAWAEKHTVDLRSTLDLTDAAFSALQAKAQDAPVRRHPREPFFRTVLIIEVLSEKEAFNGDLEDLHHATYDGDCSGAVKMRIVEQVTPAEMAQLCYAQGSDPGFFGLDDDGSLDDDDVEPDEDDLAFARETLGEAATQDEVYNLAQQRAVIAARERRRNA